MFNLPEFDSPLSSLQGLFRIDTLPFYGPGLSFEFLSSVDLADMKNISSFRDFNGTRFEGSYMNEPHQR